MQSSPDKVNLAAMLEQTPIKAYKENVLLLEEHLGVFQALQAETHLYLNPLTWMSICLKLYKGCRYHLSLPRIAHFLLDAAQRLEDQVIEKNEYFYYLKTYFLYYRAENLHQHQSQHLAACPHALDAIDHAIISAKQQLALAKNDHGKKACQQLIKVYQLRHRINSRAGYHEAALTDAKNAFNYFERIYTAREWDKMPSGIYKRDELYLLLFKAHLAVGLSLKAHLQTKRQQHFLSAAECLVATTGYYMGILREYVSQLIYNWPNQTSLEKSLSALLRKIFFNVGVANRSTVADFESCYRAIIVLTEEREARNHLDQLQLAMKLILHGFRERQTVNLEMFAYLSEPSHFTLFQERLKALSIHVVYSFSVEKVLKILNKFDYIKHPQAAVLSHYVIQKLLPSIVKQTDIELLLPLQISIGICLSSQHDARGITTLETTIQFAKRHRFQFPRTRLSLVPFYSVLARSYLLRDEGQALSAYDAAITLLQNFGSLPEDYIRHLQTLLHERGLLHLRRKNLCSSRLDLEKSALLTSTLSCRVPEDFSLLNNNHFALFKCVWELARSTHASSHQEKAHLYLQAVQHFMQVGQTVLNQWHLLIRLLLQEAADFTKQTQSISSLRQKSWQWALISFTPQTGTENTLSMMNDLYQDAVTHTHRPTTIKILQTLMKLIIFAKEGGITLEARLNDLLSYPEKLAEFKTCMTYLNHLMLHPSSGSSHKNTTPAKRQRSYSSPELFKSVAMDDPAMDTANQPPSSPKPQ